MKPIDFCNIGGLQVGHAQDQAAATGVTVVLCEDGAVAGVDVRGGAPGTRETDLLAPENLVQEVHGVMLAGGSAFGLDAAAGIMQYLEARDIGFDVQVTHVPIVCGAVLFDLHIGNPQVRPDKNMGYQACMNASAGQFALGNVGAGTGATLGKLFGMERAMKGGVGAAAVEVGDLRVGALVAVNCLGDVVDYISGDKIAGLLSADKEGMDDTQSALIKACFEKKDYFSGNTSIGVVATNARFTKAEATKLASMAQDGYARTIRPSHSMLDGDTIFALSTGNVTADLNAVGLLAAQAMADAVLSAVKNAATLHGVPAWRDTEELHSL